MKCKILCMKCRQRLFDLRVDKHSEGKLEIKCSRCKSIIEVSLEDAKTKIIV